jgi:hypothetical protein
LVRGVKMGQSLYNCCTAQTIVGDVVTTQAALRHVID